MADVFTAGVKPGGLTSSTEIRLLLCYLIKTTGPSSVSRVTGPVVLIR